jgi:hypothetical protein
MTNKQLAVIVGSIFLAVILAYQLFVGFDFRSDGERRSDEVMTEYEKKVDDIVYDACAEMEAAGGECAE